jgi:hypothetical protein
MESIHTGKSWEYTNQYRIAQRRVGLLDSEWLPIHEEVTNVPGCAARGMFSRGHLGWRLCGIIFGEMDFREA